MVRILQISGFLALIAAAVSAIASSEWHNGRRAKQGYGKAMK